MTNSFTRLPTSARMLGAAALLMVSIFSPSADAMSPVNPGSAVAKPIANVPTIEVRGGHGGGGGGRGGGWGGGRSFGGGVSSSFVRGSAGPGAMVAAPGAGAGPNRYAGHSNMGHGFGHRHHGRFFVGGVYYDDYPYDDPAYYGYPDYPAAYPASAPVAGGGCYQVLTADGPRVACQHRANRHYHRVPRRHHHRGHHRA